MSDKKTNEQVYEKVRESLYNYQREDLRAAVFKACELKDQRIAKLEEMIRESPIGFYADKENWGMETITKKPPCFEDWNHQDRRDSSFLWDDLEEIGGYGIESNQEIPHLMCGKRARAYEEKYKDELTLIRNKNKETKEG